MCYLMRKPLAYLSPILALSVTSGMVWAEDKPASTAPAAEGKTEIDAEQAAGWVRFATEIANYGKAQQDPIALISAARMLKESKVKEVPAEPAPDGKAPAASAAAKPASDLMKEWLDEAKKLAESTDKNKAEIIALADEVGRKSRGYYTRHYYYRYHSGRRCY